MITIRVLKIILFLICFGFLSNSKIQAQILNYSTKIIIDHSKKTTENSFLIQVNNKEDNWLSRIEIPHRQQQQFSLMEAKVIDKNGNTVRKLKTKEVLTKSNLSYQAFYQDDLVEEFSLFWSEYPYQIEYSYKLTEKEFLSVARWNPIVYANVATLLSSLRVELPFDYKVSHDYTGKLQFDKSLDENNRILTWTSDHFKTPKPEIYAPPLVELVPGVTITPIDFQYGVSGSTESWATFGTWQEKLNAGTDQLPETEKLIVDELISGISDKKEIIKVLYHYLQDETKYINVAIDVGGLQSYPATYVCKNKYGDCKALSTYMKALLNHAGIKSCNTLVNAGENPARIKKDIPGQQFNHVILTIPLEDDTIWLENTANYLPINYLGTFTQNRYGLMVNGNKSKLLRTPKLSAADVLEKRTITFSVNESGNWHAELKSCLRGKAFETHRYYQSQIHIDDYEEKILHDIAINNFELLKWETIEGARDDKKVNIEVSGNCGPQIRDIGNLKVIYPLHVNIPDFEAPPKRDFPVRINYPINLSDSIVYYLPSIPGYKVQLPENILLSGKNGTYEASYEKFENTLIIQENFKMNDGEYPVEEYLEFYTFIEAIKNHQKKSSIILK
jgi:transglutaminase-like putative cysteine protease